MKRLLADYFFLLLTETCSSANIGTNLVLNGHYYTKIKNPAHYEYEYAMEECRLQGGILPTIETEQNFVDTKLIASKSKDIFSLLSCVLKV